MKIESIAIDQLQADPSNARKHNKKNLDAIKGSLTKFGQQKPIVVDAKNIVIAGNGTLFAAKELGWKELSIVRSNLIGPEATAFAIADNRTSELAEWDDDILKQTLAGLDIAGFDLDQIGFDEKDFDFKDKTNKEGLTDPDQIPEVEENQYGVKTGDVWTLGNHRLMCGDCTSTSSVGTLTKGNLVDMLITDPPYNVNYVGKTKDALKIKNDQMEDSNFRKFLASAFKSANDYLKPGGVFYVWHADSEGYNFRGACVDVDWKVRQNLIWVKNSLVMGRQDYHWKHEPCLYGWKDGDGHYWASDRTQTTVLEFDRPSRSTIHPTMKPVDIIEYQIMNNSRRGEIVLDIFIGSGSTLIACEKTDRICYGMEIDPHYCSVIIKRWEDFTGQKAERIVNGQ